MDLSNYSISELVSLYSQSIKELKKRGILRTKNVVGELGEYLVFEQYYKNTNLPNLNIVPIGTKNINAVNQAHERYSIKTTTGTVTGVIYGLQPPNSIYPDKQLFEYIIICKLDEDCCLEGIYQLTWEKFLKHKRWHTRMNAWNVAITKAMKEDSVVIYEKEGAIDDCRLTSEDYEVNENIDDEADVEATVAITWNKTEKINHFEVREAAVDEEPTVAITWNKTEKVNHVEVREAAAQRLMKVLNCNFIKRSQARYVSNNNESALFVSSASYSRKNSEYWYSINDENIPWMELFPTCYVAFALGSADHILVFDFNKFKHLLEGCLRTKEDPEKNKKAHFHFSFAVDGSKVFFKKKIPEKEFIEVSDFLK